MTRDHNVGYWLTLVARVPCRCDSQACCASLAEQPPGEWGTRLFQKPGSLYALRSCHIQSCLCGILPAAERMPPSWGKLFGRNSPVAHLYLYIYIHVFFSDRVLWFPPRPDTSASCPPHPGTAVEFASLQAWDAEGMSLACGTVFPFKGILAGHAYTLLRRAPRSASERPDMPRPVSGGSGCSARLAWA